MKKFKGKALYQPTGKAAEYAAWAVNFFTGCSNGCEYCYCKRGVLSHVWDNKPNLKKCFYGQVHAMSVFQKELLANLEEVRKDGIFFSFTTDPLLSSTSFLTYICTYEALRNRVPVTILTKSTNWLYNTIGKYFLEYGDVVWQNKDILKIGFTLTGADELEPDASSNSERITAMKLLHEKGIKTWASMEPVINPITSLQIIQQTKDFCDEYKVGLMSGAKKDFYDREEMEYFYESIITLSKNHKIYLKESLLKYLGIDRKEISGNLK